MHKEGLEECPINCCYNNYLWGGVLNENWVSGVQEREILYSVTHSIFKIFVPSESYGKKNI